MTTLLIIPACTASAYNTVERRFVEYKYDDVAIKEVRYQGQKTFIPREADKLNIKSNALTPVAVFYEDFSGTIYDLYAWEGRHTAILSRRDDLSLSVMASILRISDKVYLFYQKSTGYTPVLAKNYNGKLTIADVPTTCGAGCAYLGATGIELQSTYFDKLYNEVLSNKRTFDHVIFYEFGRNFWNLSDQLAYRAPDNPDAIITGFAVFMQYLAIDATKVKVGNINGWTIAEFRSRIEEMVDLYAADSTQNWDNTLRLNRPQADNPSNLGGTDLFASFLFRLARDYGGSAFIERLWKEAAKRPAATSTQDAVDNFFLAASAAANQNLTTLFTVTWRWPISAAAQVAATRYPT